MYQKCERCGRDYGMDATLVSAIGGVKVVLCAKCLRAFDDFIRPTAEWGDWRLAGDEFNDALKRAEGSESHDPLWDALPAKRLKVRGAGDALRARTKEWVKAECDKEPA